MDSSEDKQSNYAANPPPKCHIIPLSSPTFNFIQISPFSRQPTSSSNPNLRFLMETSKVVREVRNSIASNVEKCLEMLDNLRSQNGVLDKVMSFPSYLQNGFQKLPRRNMRTLGMPSNLNFAAILPGDSVAGIVVTNGILNFLNIYNTLLVVRLVLTWFPNAPPAIVSPLSTLCDPYLNIFRGIIPPLGGLDLSPILAFLILNALTSTASALPAELPSEASNGTQSPAPATRLTASQKKWMKRFSSNKSKNSNGAIIQRSSRFSSRDKKILAIALAILAMLSPIYIDRKSIPEPEDDEESMFLSSSYLLPLLQVLLMTAIAISVYLERGFTRLDPYWIHRVGGSSTGIVIILMVLTLVLKCKATN